MPEVNQYAISHKEIVELIIKSAGIHEGRWWLSLNLGFTAGNFGPSEDNLSPGAVIAVTNVVIQREIPGVVAPRSLMVDAAQVNPAPGAKPKKKSRASKTST